MDVKLACQTCNSGVTYSIEWKTRSYDLLLNLYTAVDENSGTSC